MERTAPIDVRDITLEADRHKVPVLPGDAIRGAEPNPPGISFALFGTAILIWHDLPNGVSVSTVSSALTSFFRSPGLLWETMIFGGPHDEYQERYSSSAAYEGHIKAVAIAVRVLETVEFRPELV